MSTPPTYAELRQAGPRSSDDMTIFAGYIRRMITRDGQGWLRLNIDADYQRGPTWPLSQAAAFVGHKLEGGDNPTLTVQRWADDATDDLVDGKQRLLAVLGFMEGTVPAALSDGGSYFLREWSKTDQAAIEGTGLVLRARVVKLPTRAAVLRFYLRMIEGSTPHSSDEIERVRGLLKKELAGHTPGS